MSQADPVPTAGDGEVLLHSLGVLAPVIEPALEIAGARRIIEVGVEAGGMTRVLREYAARVGGECVGVDPGVSPDVRATFAGDPYVRLVEAPSPRALDEVGPADAYVLDGDHNYWTVLEELRAVARALGDGHNPVVFLHDVGWPAGRRDQYYDPSRLPAEAVHPYTFAQGVRPGTQGTVEGGFRGEGAFAWAIEEGGPRNGVRTALEDFLGECDRFRSAIVPIVFGLAVLWPGAAPFADALEDHLRFWADNPVLATVEQNRLALYSRVLLLQDQLSDAADAGPRLRDENARLRGRALELEARLARIRGELEAIRHLKALHAVDVIERPARRRRPGRTLRARLTELHTIASPTENTEP